MPTRAPSPACSLPPECRCQLPLAESKIRPFENDGDFPYVALGEGDAMKEARRILRRHPLVTAMIVARRPFHDPRYEYMTIAEHRWPRQFMEVGWERVFRLTR